MKLTSGGRQFNQGKVDTIQVDKVSAISHEITLSVCLPCMFSVLMDASAQAPKKTPVLGGVSCTDRSSNHLKVAPPCCVELISLI